MLLTVINIKTVLISSDQQIPVPVFANRHNLIFRQFSVQVRRAKRPLYIVVQEKSFVCPDPETFLLVDMQT